MDRLDQLEQVVKSLNETVKELQAEVKALKGEPINLDTNTNKRTFTFTLFNFSFGKPHKVPEKRSEKNDKNCSKQ